MLRLHEYAYHRPRALDAALELLGREDALPIGGGTDLVPNMKHRLFTPRHLVGLRGIPELRGIGEVAASADLPAHLWIGAGETLARIARDPRVQRHAPALASAAGQVAGPQIRNRGTIGGNLCLDTRCTYYNQSHFWRQALGYCLKKDGDVCHVTRVGRKCVAAHSADTPPVLIATGGWIELVSREGARRVPAADFFVADGAWNTVRRRGEIVRGLGVPLARAGVRSGYLKVRQRAAIDFPILSIAARTGLAGDGTVESVALVVSALGSRPRVVSGLEAVVGERMETAAEAAAELAHRQCHPLENIGADPEWRRAMIPVHVRRLLASL